VLTVKPDNLVVSLGGRAILRCSTDSNTPVSWAHKSVGSKTFDELLFLTGEIYFEHRYAIVHSSDESFDLVIISVSELDAGLYSCRDRDGRPGEDFGEADLIAVRDSSSSCEATASDVIVEGDTLTMFCSVEYLTRPTFMNVVHIAWIDVNDNPASLVGEDSEHIKRVTTNNSSKWSTVESKISAVINATDNTTCCYRCVIDSSMGGNWSVSFSCDLSRSGAAVQYRVRNVRLYNNTTMLSDERHVANVGDTIQCRADGNPPPDYMWSEGSSGRNVSSGSEVSLRVAGDFIYRCSTSNVIRNLSYHKTVEINVTVRVPYDRHQEPTIQLIPFHQITVYLFVISNSVLLVFMCVTNSHVVCGRKPASPDEELNPSQVDSDEISPYDYDDVVLPMTADNLLRIQSDPSTANFTDQVVDPAYSSIGELSPPSIYQLLINGQYNTERHGEPLTRDPTYCTATGELSPPSFYEPLVISPRVAPRIINVARIKES